MAGRQPTQADPAVCFQHGSQVGASGPRARRGRQTTFPLSLCTVDFCALCFVNSQITDIPTKLKYTDALSQTQR